MSSYVNKRLHDDFFTVYEAIKKRPIYMEVGRITSLQPILIKSIIQPTQWIRFISYLPPINYIGTPKGKVHRAWTLATRQGWWRQDETIAWFLKACMQGKGKEIKSDIL